MRVFILCTALLLCALKVEAVPPIPDDATFYTSGPIGECGGSLVLSYVYTTKDGNTIVIMKKPNKEAVVYFLYANPPEIPGDILEVYVRDEKMTEEQLRSRYPNLCSAFNEVKL